MTEVFIVKSCDYQDSQKVTKYLQETHPEAVWTEDIKSSAYFPSYAEAQESIRQVIKPGDLLQVEKYFVTLSYE